MDRTDLRYTTHKHSLLQRGSPHSKALKKNKNDDDESSLQLLLLFFFRHDFFFFFFFFSRFESDVEAQKCSNDHHRMLGRKKNKKEKTKRG